MTTTAGEEGATGRENVIAAAGTWPGWIPPGGLARAVLILGGAIHLLFLISLVTQWLNPLFLESVTADGQAGDFFGIHQAGRNLLDGVSIYDCENYRREAVPVVPYAYFYRYLPPTSYLAALGAALWDAWTGYWVWVAINEALLLWLLASLWRWPSAPLPVRWGLIGVTLGFFPFYLEQWMGQYSFLMSLCIWLVLRSEMRGARDGKGPTTGSWSAELRSTAFWGWVVSLAVKSYTLLFALVFLLRRRWRPIVLAGVLVALLSVPYFVARPEDLVEFLRLNLKPLPHGFLPARYGAVAVVKILSHHLVGGSSVSLDIGFKTVEAIEIPVYAWILLVTGISFLVTLRTHRRARSEHLLILWLTTFFCVYKDIWEYHHVMLLPALYVLALSDRSRLSWLFLVWLAVPTANVWDVEFWSTTPQETWGALRVAIHHVYYALPVLLLHLWMIWKCLAATEPQDREPNLLEVGTRV